MNVILFDGFCNLCNKTILFLIKHDKNNQLYFAAQQTNAGCKIINQYGIQAGTASVIFIKNGAVYVKSDAVIEIAKLLTGWPRILIAGKIIPLNMRNWIYNLIAKYRYKVFGKKNECAIPAKEHMHKFIS